MSRVFLLYALICTALAVRPVQGVVISEIHYRPPAGEESLEFIEIANETASPEDLSGCTFVEGIDFRLPAGTILGPRGFLVICLDAAAVKARYGIANAIGNFAGHLDGAGERITLADLSGIPIATVRYKSDGQWPIAAWGTGHSLVLRNLLLDPGDPESWAASPDRGGSPGLPNFGDGTPKFNDRPVVAAGDAWRYRKGTGPFSDPPEAWREPAFDDAAWDEGPTAIGFGETFIKTNLTDMLNSYTSIASRKRFLLSAEDLAASGDFYLGVDFDDGLRAYLNGVEVARGNCGTVGEDRTWDKTASGSREYGKELLFLVPRSALREGENVLAAAVYNSSIGNTDFVFLPRFFLRQEIPTAGALANIVFNELCRGAAAQSGWVEIWNADPVRADLSGLRLSADPVLPGGHLFPAGSTMEAGGFLAVEEEAPAGLDFSAPRVRLFLLAPDGRAVTAACFDRPPPPGIGPGAWSEARFPDGGPLEWVTVTPTLAAPNQVERIEDIVINEIFYHPPENRIGEFIEIFNRGAGSVDLAGFRFDKGIEFLFPSGTMLPALGYLVVAEDPAVLKERYGLDGALGPYVGHLSNRGERVRLVDGAGNPVDEVRYGQGGSWSELADSGGSSLELIDPRQDNSFPSAWEASDEAGKSVWQEFSYHVNSFKSGAESELHLFLAAGGSCLLDDVSIVRAGGANLIANPGFETSTSPWVIQGTHIASRRITGDFHSGSACLQVEASGKGDTLVNRIETDTKTAMTTGAYDLSLWARWLRGSNLLIAHGPFSAGSFGGRPSPATNLSGNSLGVRLRLPVPMDLGTPGAENGATRRLREAAGDVNLGPVIDSVRHKPASPSPTQQAVVTARIADADGVASAKVYYRTDNASGAFTAADLADSGLGGIFSGPIPPFTATRRVVFYIEAVDGRGASRRLPVDAPAKTFLYQVGTPITDRLDVCRVILDTARTQELQSRTLHSNDLLDGTFVLNDQEVYYNVGVRYRGSPWGRPSRANLRIRFPDDRPYRGLRAVNLSSRGSSPNEGAVHYLEARSSGAGVPIPVADYRWARVMVNGTALGIYGVVQTVDSDFLGKWYGEDATGPALKAVGRIDYHDDLQWLWDGASYIHMGNETENYRGYFTHAVRRTEDVWEPLFALTKVMDPKSTPNAAFDAAVGGILDVEEFLRNIGTRTSVAEWDAFSVGNGHNGYLIYDSRNGRWQLIPFDMDNSFGGGASLFPTADPSVTRLMARPAIRRIYYRVLAEMLGPGGAWNAAATGPFLDAVQTASGIGTAGIKSYISSWAVSIKAAVQASTLTKFRILTNSGNAITTEAVRIDLDGEAPVQVAVLVSRVGNGDLQVFEPPWSSQVRWKAGFDLVLGDNLFDFYGFDTAGALVGSTSITVHVVLDLQVSDWSPRSGPSTGGTLVTLHGTGFTAGMQVLFGGLAATTVTVQDATLATVVVPAAPSPLPAGGLVDIEIVVSPSNLKVLPNAYTYEGPFIRGDSNGDLVVDIADAIATLEYLFSGGTLTCLDAADSNDSGKITVTDAILVLNWFFKGGEPPAPPFSQPAYDPTPDELGCGR